jgi:hypothetical protein
MGHGNRSIRETVFDRERIHKEKILPPGGSVDPTVWPPWSRRQDPITDD